ncbi:hypothetical protein E2I00_005490 [Balaenoptera physalus]|uniref:Uncharacterized protein n=1 Tax=Balaenoptera physalus TaxID=9770 RepID=A0A643CBK6_BALPH|nr:hypothetical protein E2I00_005490 [Balaenoptera physalus]
MDIITKFLKFLLGVCAKELNVREDYVKHSMRGKLNSATQNRLSPISDPFSESYGKGIFLPILKNP